MKSQAICAVALATAGLAALAGPAGAGPRHWFYDSYGAYDRGAVVEFGFWAGPRPRAPRYYAPYRPRYYAPYRPPYYAGYPPAYAPAYPGPQPVTPEYYYEAAPGQFVPIYGDDGEPVAAPDRNRARANYRQPSVPFPNRPRQGLAYVPKPMPKPPVPETLAATAPRPGIVETDTAASKATGPAIIAKDKIASKATGPAISCDKARQIISGFGFTDVRTLGCAGKEYGFAARRDGKDFEVRLSSLTGELIQVKRR